MPTKIPAAVETRHAKLKCEGTCFTVTEHSFHSVRQGLDNLGGPCDFFMFACKACGKTRVWGTQAGTARNGGTA